MILSPDDLLKILLSVLVGGAIGLERELHHKAAGFRTITLICMGAALFTILDNRMGGSARIAANIVTGIGFLGAGVILHETNRIRGLTTAAAVWMSAALGMALGEGAYLLSLTALVVVMVVMEIFLRLERRMDFMWDMRHYQIVLPCDPQKVEQIEKLLVKSGLRVSVRQQMKHEGLLVCTWDVSGSTSKQNAFVQSIIADPELKEIQW